MSFSDAHDINGNIVLSKHYRYTPVFPHEHEFFEILCLYDGTAHTAIQGIEHTLHTGDICIIPPHTTHSVGIFNDSVAFNILVRSSTFHSTFFQSLTADSALTQFFAHVLYRKTVGNYLIFHSGNDAQIHDMLENLYIEYLGHAKYSYTFLNSMLVMFWAMLLRFHENDIESILTKDSTGRTFLQIIRDIKLNQACHALRETSLSNLAICELVGYESPEHFMRTFKKTYGMTPGEYRKKNRE